MIATRTALAAAVVTTAVTLALAACSRDAAPRQAPLPPDEATTLLAQRIWLDQEPRGPSDKFNVLVFDGQRSGVVQERTIWKGSFEVFVYEADRGRLNIKLPGSRKQLKTGFSIERAKRGDADVKLTLDKAPAGPTVYYGYRFDGHDADAWVAEHFARD